ncbi:MAG TPA: 3-hexulose-6-phosphate synthase [Armatimonadota bacterium]|nr:3-hexulose-6-phosphate synthase [Armatimonadota bacterium]
MSERPILQVALDFVDLPRALQMAKEAVEGGADWIEAGTPLIKSAGFDAVRRLKELFPQKTIVADLKIMDAGRIEVEYAAKSGAGVVTVLAAASDMTIAECVEAGRHYGAKVVADLINIADPLKRAKELETLGVDYIGVHTPIDVQMQGRFPFDTLKAIAQEVSTPLCVAGGITSETAADAVASGATVAIVGGAITKSKDAVSATRAIREALDKGQRIESTLFKRATADTIRDILSQVSAANVSDAMHRGGVAPGIHPLVPGMRCVGQAVTVRTAPGDWAKPVQAIDQAGPGDVLVIDVGGVAPSPWGELATNSAKQRGIEGIIIDGAARDSGDIRKLDMPVFCKFVCPNAGEPKGFGEIGATIHISGVTVNPGDWIIADDDGVVVIPQAQAVEITNRAMNVLETENRLREEIQRGSTLGEVAELLKWEKK